MLHFKVLVISDDKITKNYKKLKNALMVLKEFLIIFQPFKIDKIKKYKQKKKF